MLLYKLLQKLRLAIIAKCLQQHSESFTDVCSKTTYIVLNVYILSTMFHKSSYCYLLPIVALCAICPSGQALTEAEFKQRLQSKVSTPFTACIKDYNSALTHFSQLLDTYDPEDDMPPEISPQLTTSINGFVNNVKTASSNSHSLAEETSKSVAHQTNLVSQTESKIQANDKQIKQNQEKVKGKQVEVNQAQQALNTANKNLNTHRDALRRAQDRYNDARNKCLGRRRRKRGLFKSIRRAIKKTVSLPVKVVKETVRLPKKVIKEAVRGICKTLNVFTKNIDKAKRDVGNAEGQVNNANAQLSQKRNELAATKNHLANLQKQQASLNNQRGQLQSQLNSLKSKRDRIQAIDQKMKATVVFIDNIKSGGISAKFVVDVGYLIDASNLFEPLVEIGNAMKGLSGQSSSNFIPKLSSAQINALTSKLNQIREGQATF